jgi:hypothetical protein
MLEIDDELFSKLFAELYLVSNEEKELKASPPIFLGLIIEDELPLLMDEAFAFLSSLAVPKSASTRCQDSLKSKLPGFKSLCMIFFLFMNSNTFTIYAI